MKRKQRVASCSSSRVSFPKWPFEIKNSFKANETEVNLDKLRFGGMFYEKLMRSPEINLNIAL